MAKNKKGKDLDFRVVYSTNSDFDMDAQYEQEETETLANNLQLLYVSLDRKNRGGKAVTLIEGFVGSDDDLTTLGKTLKTHCGVGGNVKDGEILLQGDQRDKIVAWLTKNGYKFKRKGG